MAKEREDLKRVKEVYQKIIKGKYNEKDIKDIINEIEAINIATAYNWGNIEDNDIKELEIIEKIQRLVKPDEAKRIQNALLQIDETVSMAEAVDTIAKIK